MTGMSREEALWAELVDEAGEEEIEEAASVSVEQAEAELRAAGFDVDAENARAEAFLAWLEGTGSARDAGLPAEAEALVDRAARPAAPEVSKVVPIAEARRRRRPLVAWVAAAAAAAASAAAIYVETSPPGVAHPAPSDEEVAASLRARATVACDDGRAKECLSLLDEARAMDPAGDAEPEMARLRAKAEALLRGDAPPR